MDKTRPLIEFDLRTPAHADDLVIDNTTLPAEEAASLIAEHVGLVTGITSHQVSEYHGR